jgi:hypothetical protein
MQTSSRPITPRGSALSRRDPPHHRHRARGRHLERRADGGREQHRGEPSPQGRLAGPGAGPQSLCRWPVVTPGLSHVRHAVHTVRFTSPLCGIALRSARNRQWPHPFVRKPPLRDPWCGTADARPAAAENISRRGGMNGGRNGDTAPAVPTTTDRAAAARVDSRWPAQDRSRDRLLRRSASRRRAPHAAAEDDPAGERLP